MSQYALTLPLDPVFSADNFFISECNRTAWDTLQRWPNWGAHALILSGPAGSGKTHLAELWRARVGAACINAAALDARTAGSNGHWLVEDIEGLRDERLLLHLFNATREQGGGLLMTSAVPAAQLPFTLPDLTSRLLAAASASIAQPDDAVLAASFRKQFADRQMKVDEEVIAYIVPRIERSLGAVKTLVETLDRTTLETRKNLTIPFVKHILERGML